MPDLTQQTQQTQQTTRTSSTSNGGTGADAQSLVGNQAVASNPQYTGIVTIGMNEYAHNEISHLNKLNADKGGAKGIRSSKEQDTLVRGNKKLNLNDAADRTSFIGGLGLKPDVAARATDILANGGYQAKDELAQIIEVYAQAEAGVRRMDRIVLSGHSVGDQIWGDNNGELPFDTFTDLKNLFPKAAAQVKHLMVSACYGGGEGNLTKFHAMFPALQSIWAYSGSSPGTWSGAMDHMTQWEGATEKGDGSNVEKDLARGTRKADNVATWNGQDGYQGSQPKSLWELQSEYASQESTFQRFNSGAEEVSNPQSGPLRDYYNLIQRLVSHPDLDGGQVAAIKERRDTTIRLIFFKVIAKKFGASYAGQLKSGYDDAKRPLPDWSNLGRGAAMSEAAAFEAAAAAGQTANTDKVADLLKRGLVGLDSTLIPTTWV